MDHRSVSSALEQAHIFVAVELTEGVFIMYSGREFQLLTTLWEEKLPEVKGDSVSCTVSDRDLSNGRMFHCWRFLSQTETAAADTILQSWPCIPIFRSELIGFATKLGYVLSKRINSINKGKIPIILKQANTDRWDRYLLTWADLTAWNEARAPSWRPDSLWLSVSQAQRIQPTVNILYHVCC